MDESPELNHLNAAKTRCSPKIPYPSVVHLNVSSVDK